MKGHAALGNLEQVQRIARKLCPAIDHCIPDAAADNNAEHAVEKEVVDLHGIDRRISALATSSCQPPGEYETDDIHQTVPANFDKPD